jgi:hypothetical protein
MRILNCSANDLLLSQKQRLGKQSLFRFLFIFLQLLTCSPQGTLQNEDMYEFVQCAQRTWYKTIYMPQKSAAKMMLSNREKYATPESYNWVTTGDEHATSQKS